MNPLETTLKELLANMFVTYFKAHSYHWNVEGRNFSQDHAFLNGLYDTFHDQVDTIAEEMRALGVYAPVSLEDLYPSKTITEDTIKPINFEAMVSNLLTCNDAIIVTLNKLFADSTTANNQGLANFAADLLDKHAKHGWMLRSYLKSSE